MQLRAHDGGETGGSLGESRACLYTSAVAATSDDDPLHAVDVPDVTSPEDELEPTTVDDTQGPSPHTQLSPPVPGIAAKPPANGVADVEITSTTLTGNDVVPIPLTLPANVEIREAKDDEPVDDTEVRTLVTDSPPVSTDPAPASEPPDEQTLVGTNRAPSAPRQLIPRSGPTPTGSRKGVILPELDDDDGKDDDAYEADESATLRGPARVGGTAPTMPGVAKAGAAAAPTPYENDADEAADDADSVTKPAPKPLIPRFVSADDAAREDQPENQTAVMTGSPYKPPIATTPLTPAGPVGASGSVWLPNAPRTDSEKSAKAVAEKYSTGERASIGALLSAPVARREPGSGGQAIASDSALVSSSYPYPVGHTSIAAPPTALPTPPDGAPVRRSGYLWLVAGAAIVSLVVPLAIFLALRTPAPTEPDRTPAQVVADPVPLADQAREKAPKTGTTASVPPAPGPTKGTPWRPAPPKKR